MSAQPRDASTSSKYRSDVLLQVVTTCMSDLLMAESVQQALPATLEAVARVVHIDRMLVLERLPARAPPSLPYSWSSPQAPPRLDFDAALAAVAQGEALAEWAQPLREGRPVIAHVSSSDGAVRALLTQLGVTSVLQVPIFVGGAYWGHIAFEDCHGEHDWSTAEINVLKILADLVGAAVTRDRWLQELRRANTTDALTGLINRATFSQHLQKAFAAARAGGAPFAVLYLDLDGFKEVNDTRGHPAGDRLLQAVAARLLGIAAAGEPVARVGGDEFALLQFGAEPLVAGELASRIITSLSRPYRLDDDQVTIGASVGVALYCAGLSQADELLVRADQALYRAKQDGRGQYRLHSEGLEREAREWTRLAEEFRAAMEHGQLELYYQAQFELRTRAIAGMEALVRWHHPTRGLLLPDAFLGVVERAGIGQGLGRWVLDGACRQLARWRAAGARVPLMAVNVALGQIRAGRDFVADVAGCLCRWGLMPQDLELDVSERILARATPMQHDVLRELRRLGVGIAIDDFGAEYSSLNYLKAYDVRRVKIAPAVVAAIRPGEGSVDVIRAIAAMTGELGIEVIAEGVESETQRALLAEMPTHPKGQGFFFSRPMPADEATQLLLPGAA